MSRDVTCGQERAIALVTITRDVLRVAVAAGHGVRLRRGVVLHAVLGHRGALEARSRPPNPTVKVDPPTVGRGVAVRIVAARRDDRGAVGVGALHARERGTALARVRLEGGEAAVESHILRAM